MKFCLYNLNSNKWLLHIERFWHKRFRHILKFLLLHWSNRCSGSTPWAGICWYFANAFVTMPVEWGHFLFRKLTHYFNFYPKLFWNQILHPMNRLIRSSMNRSIDRTRMNILIKLKINRYKLLEPSVLYHNLHRSFLHSTIELRLFVFFVEITPSSNSMKEPIF